MTSVGIDVSKVKSTVCILRPYGEVIASPYEVQHSEPEIKELISRIKAVDGEVQIVMEATGAYHLPLLSSFKEAGLFVSVVNPLSMKRYASTAIRKGKTDKMDAVRIANYGLTIGLSWWIIYCRMKYTPSLEFWGGNTPTILRFGLKVNWL